MKLGRLHNIQSVMPQWERYTTTSGFWRRVISHTVDEISFFYCCAVAGYRSHYAALIDTHCVPFANLSRRSGRRYPHPYGIGVFALSAVQTGWIEGSPSWDRESRKWSSFTHLKIKHLTGSSACVSPPCGSTRTHKHSHTYPLRCGCVIVLPC